MSDPNLPLDDNDLILVDRFDASVGGKHTALTGAAMRGWTGWGDYVDTEYTELNPFQPTPLVWTPIPNNAGAGPRNQEPLDTGPLFADGKIIGRNGDALVITKEFVLVPTTANITYVDICINIGGSIGRIYERTITTPKGQGVPRTVSLAVGAYTLDTWEANGGVVEVNPTHAVDIYDFRLVIERTHKART